MKKAFIVILIIFCTTMIVTAINDSSSETANPFAESTWQFKNVVSENPSTVHYLTALYGKSAYRFSDDHTYSGTFFELPISGTWEISDDTLVLNNGTSKEESFTFTFLTNNNLVLQTTEKGDNVIIEFEKQ